MSCHSLIPSEAAHCPSAPGREKIGIALEVNKVMYHTVHGDRDDKVMYHTVHGDRDDKVMYHTVHGDRDDSKL